MMGLALYYFWQARKRDKHDGFAFFGLQLGLNTLWSVLFFGFHQTWAAFGTILLLWVFIILTISAFSRQSKAAAWLLVPYLAWVTFAGALNLAVALLN